MSTSGIGQKPFLTGGNFNIFRETIPQLPLDVSSLYTPLSNLEGAETNPPQDESPRPSTRSILFDPDRIIQNTQASTLLNEARELRSKNLFIPAVESAKLGLKANPGEPTLIIQLLIELATNYELTGEDAYALFYFDHALHFTYEKGREEVKLRSQINQSIDQLLQKQSTDPKFECMRLFYLKKFPESAAEGERLLSQSASTNPQFFLRFLIAAHAFSDNQVLHGALITSVDVSYSEKTEFCANFLQKRVLAHHHRLDRDGMQKCALKILELDPFLGDVKADAYVTLAIIFFEKNEFVKAIINAQKGLAYCSATSYRKAVLHEIIGNSMLCLGNKDAAHNSAKKGLQLIDACLDENSNSNKQNERERLNRLLDRIGPIGPIELKPFKLSLGIQVPDLQTSKEIEPKGIKEVRNYLERAKKLNEEKKYPEAIELVNQGLYLIVALEYETTQKSPSDQKKELSRELFRELAYAKNKLAKQQATEAAKNKLYFEVVLLDRSEDFDPKNSQSQALLSLYYEILLASNMLQQYDRAIRIGQNLTQTAQVATSQERILKAKFHMQLAQAYMMKEQFAEAFLEIAYGLISKDINPIFVNTNLEKMSDYISSQMPQ